MLLLLLGQVLNVVSGHRHRSCNASVLHKFSKSQSRVCQTWCLGTCLSMRSKPAIGPAAPSTSGGRLAPKSKPLHSLSAIVSAALVLAAHLQRDGKYRGGGRGGGERGGGGLCCTFRPFRPFSDHLKSKNLILDVFCCFFQCFSCFGI